MTSKKKWSLPSAVIYVADTACCGLRVHNPRDAGAPAHYNQDRKTFETCKILRYWEYAARRQIARAEILSHTR